MKKLIASLLIILAGKTAYSLPIGNPSDASLLCDGLIWEGHCGDPCDPCLTWCDAFSVRIGFYGDYVFNRHMEVDDHSHDSDIEHTEIYTNAGMIAANLWDRIDLFTTLGATNLYIDTNSQTFGLATSARFEIETETCFSWSIGARGTIWECGCTLLGIEAQYFYTKPHVTRASDAAATSIYPANNIKAKYWEWQIGVGISHRINMLVPYAAIKYAKAQLSFGDAILPFNPPANLFDLNSKNGWGYAIGVSLIDCEKASLTVEGRFGGEKALHVNGQLRF